MRRVVINYTTTLFLLLCWECVLAQPAIEHLQRISYPEGLSDRTVTSIIQDQKGFLWIATNNGLNRHDGNRIEVFDNNAKTRFQIEENRITRVEEIAGQRLVMLNDRKEQFFEILELNTFQNTVVRFPESGVVDGKVRVIYPEKLGSVYLLTEKRDQYLIYKMNDDQRFTKVAEVGRSAVAKEEEVDFVRGRSGNFYISDTVNGLLVVNEHGELLRHIGVDEFNDLTSPVDITYKLSTLYEDRRGYLWLSHPLRRGILFLPPGGDHFRKVAGLPEDEIYMNVWEDEAGRLLFGTYQSFGTLKKLFLVDTDRSVQDYGGILNINDKINHIHSFDFNRQLLLGTYTGFYKVNFASRKIKWVLAERQLNDNEWDEGISIRNITGDGQGNIYIARELKAWYHLKMPEMVLDTIELWDYAGNRVNLWCCSNIIFDPAGYLWGGSCTDNRDGLLHRYSLKDKRVKTYSTKGKVIRHMIRAGDGQLILVAGASDFDGKLVFFDPVTEIFTEYMDEDGTNPLAGRLPNFILESRSGKFWIGTDEGLIGIDPDLWQSHLFNRREGHLTNDDILVIHEADDERLWLGTHGGLNILNVVTGSVEAYSTSDGLCNNIVCGIVPGKDGSYFLSTFYGLSRFDPQTKLFSNLFQGKGLTFNEFNRLAYYQDEDENYYFGTLNGVNIFKNEDLKDPVYDRFPLQLTSVEIVKNEGGANIQYTNLQATDNLVLTHRDDYFRLEFALPNYKLPEKNEYAAKLEGVDTIWRYLGYNAYYQHNVPSPGYYRLRIKAAPADGLWQTEDLLFNIEVKEVFYKTTWFLILLPVALLSLGYLIARIFIRRIRDKEEEQTRINKRFAELELQALQSQMNPHFVFNSLGAIQYFIQNHNLEMADDYLAKFAKLMRLFLESSKNKYIPLSEEIKLLSLYLELESMRFDHTFDSEIIVGKGVNPYSIELPSVLIQPFVENAINHGLFHKKERGCLKINFYRNSAKALVCVITDDGVGRKKAEIIKNNSSRKHRSRGMQIVRERLEVLQLMDEMKIQIEVTDLYPDAEYTGTKVKIVLPFLE